MSVSQEDLTNPESSPTIDIALHDGSVLTYGEPFEMPRFLGSEVRDGLLMVAVLVEGPDDEPWIATNVWPLANVHSWTVTEPARTEEAPNATE